MAWRFTTINWLISTQATTGPAAAPAYPRQLTRTASQESSLLAPQHLNQPDDAPEEFVCPLSRRVMVDPVVAADGLSYERAAIAAAFLNEDARVAQLPHQMLVPNVALAKLIRRGLPGGDVLRRAVLPLALVGERFERLLPGPVLAPSSAPPASRCPTSDPTTTSRHDDDVPGMTTRPLR